MAYTLLEYIRSSGTQYINTGFIPNSNTRVVMDAQLKSTATSKFYFGVRDASYSNGFSVLVTGTGIRSDYKSSQKTFTNIDLLSRVLIDKNKNVCTINGTKVTNDAATFSSGFSLNLFASNDANSAGYIATMDLYSCQIYDDGTLARDYVPVMDESGNVGLLDRVNNAFYKDAAGGNFTAGPGIASEYKMVDAAMLDKAMTATANAIRAKTGKSAALTWDESSGFRAAVEAISVGAGLQYATGTITPDTTTSSTVGTELFSLSGLSFKPKIVVIRMNGKFSSTNFGSKYNVGAVFGSSISEAWNGRMLSYTAGSYNRLDDEFDVDFAFTSSGFIVRQEESGEHKMHSSYQYIAIG